MMKNKVAPFYLGHGVYNNYIHLNIVQLRQ